jgi:hypothetical protein
MEKEQFQPILLKNLDFVRIPGSSGRPIFAKTLTRNRWKYDA